MSDFQQTITSLNLLHTSLYRMELFMNAQAVKNAKTDVISLISRLEKAERERDELRDDVKAYSEHLQYHINRQCKAEAELARRDAAAGEFRRLFTCSGCSAEGLDAPLETRCDCCIDGAEWVESKLYTAAQPAVLPPDITFESKGFRSLTSEDIAYNLALMKAREMGGQGQKVVALPSNIRTELVNVLTWIERLPVPTISAAAKAIRLRKVISEIDAANVKWEVKK